MVFVCFTLLQADKSSPVFKDLYHSTAIAFHADFTKLYAMAHQEAIMTTVEWVTDLQTRIVTLLSASSGAASRGQLAPKADAAKRRKNSASSNVSTLEKKSKKLKTKSTLSAIVEDQLSDISKSILALSFLVFHFFRDDFLAKERPNFRPQKIRFV